MHLFFYALSTWHSKPNKIQLEKDIIDCKQATRGYILHNTPVKIISLILTRLSVFCSGKLRKVWMNFLWMTNVDSLNRKTPTHKTIETDEKDVVKLKRFIVKYVRILCFGKCSILNGRDQVQVVHRTRISMAMNTLRPAGSNLYTSDNARNAALLWEIHHLFTQPSFIAPIRNSRNDKASTITNMFCRRRWTNVRHLSTKIYLILLWSSKITSI